MLTANQIKSQAKSLGLASRQWMTGHSLVSSTSGYGRGMPARCTTCCGQRLKGLTLDVYYRQLEWSFHWERCTTRIGLIRSNERILAKQTFPVMRGKMTITILWEPGPTHYSSGCERCTTIHSTPGRMLILDPCRNEFMLSRRV